ncbi:MAG TPA: hypothetical protein VGX91_04000 [Candidatus Cybelea sp.]|jgi:hypothetical protein|nr:hypothetical protein [Candidatus Cybelea sp.]
MRSSPLPIGVTWFLMAALTACGGASGGGSAPALATFGSGAARDGPAPLVPRGYMSPKRMLELQLAGKLPSALHHRVLEHILRDVEAHRRLDLRVNPNLAVGMWVSGGYFGYIFGQISTGRETATVINTVNNGCYYNYGLKVDHLENLWTSCFNNAYAEGGAIQEYAHNKPNKPSDTYFDYASCGSGCKFYGFPNDVATDESGHVFAANVLSEVCNSSSGCSYDEYAASWWNANAPNSTATGIIDSNFQQTFYADTDKSGNLYLDGYGCTYSSTCGYLLDEISNPTSSSPTITNIIPLGNAYLQGVYVSNAGTVLNVVEPNSRKVARYALPFVPSETPTYIGPTNENYAGFGSPIDGGVNRAETLMALGDAWGWVDLGNLQTKKWSTTINININQDNLSAQYVPSDK